ncbi:MAG TPA: ABC transporter substrate-binding protein, partial [Solirubrobacteraceae bacterium]
MSRRRRVLGFMAAAAAVAAVAGCGELTNTVHPPAGTANNLSVELDYFPNADHVGIYEALARGFFRQADINVHLHAPTNAATPLQLLEAGKVDVAISYEPDVLLARNQNIPLVSV